MSVHGKIIGDSLFIGWIVICFNINYYCRKQKSTYPFGFALLAANIKFIPDKSTSPSLQTLLAMQVS